MFIRAIRKARRFARDRRAFLRLTAAGGGAAVAAGLIRNALAEPEHAPVQPEDQHAKQGYRETAHIREYYNKARF